MASPHSMNQQNTTCNSLLHSTDQNRLVIVENISSSNGPHLRSQPSEYKTFCMH